MSPNPPNKNMEDKNVNSNGNGTIEASNETEENYELVDENENNQGANLYEPIPQNQPTNPNDEDDDDEDDDDDDDEFSSGDEIDPDAHFEMFASSRVFEANNKPKTNQKPECYNNNYLFEQDVFERRNQLESEDIVLDEAKSKTINNLMSNFKLPESSIPDWAKKVPEDHWKKNLLESLNAKKTDLFTSKTNQLTD